MSAIFLPEDVRELLKGKTVIYIGDSVQRSMYKDLVLLFQDKRYLTDQELRAKGELCFLGDELMEGGRKGEMTNSTKYREVRKFLFDSQTKVLYFFITACFGEYIEMVLQKLMKPDIIFMNSCLWDVHRYGTKGYEGYGPNLKKLVRLLKELHPTVLFAWTTTPPVDIRSKAGFLEDRKDLVKINEVLRCNDIARQIMSHEDIPIADFADVFRHFTHHRANDGVHWNERAHRRMTNILLETVARHLNRPVPRPVGDEFNHNLDFDDRPPFPHSFSQPAFHHNDSWGSADEFNWYNDGYMNYSAHDDFILGLDRSYEYGNHGYFERDDEMSQRFLPPPGRRMPPPAIRGPPPPPGYRYGTGDQGMMWEGRKRKVWDDDTPDGFNKRQHMEDNRRYPGSKKMPSSIVENKPKLDEAQKPVSPECDEKPATSKPPAPVEEKATPMSSTQTQDNNDESRKGIPENNSEPKVEDQKPVLVQSKGDLQVAKSYISTNSIGNGEHKVHLSVPPEEQKTANSVPQEKAVVQAEPSAADGKEVSVGVLAGPCKDEIPGPDAELFSDPENPATVPSDAIKIGDKSGATEKPSVFSRLSHTTSLILQSIQKSWKPVPSEMLAQSKPSDSGIWDTIQNQNSEEEEKVLQLPEVALEEKSETAAEEDILLRMPENGTTENLGKNKPEISDSGEAAKVKGISYYDIEENLDDLVASLDKIDDDGIMDSMDLDEESLLLDDSDQLPSLIHGSHITKMDVEVKNNLQSSRDEILDKQKDFTCSQDPKIDNQLKSFSEKQLEVSTVSLGRELDKLSPTALIDSGSLDSRLDSNESNRMERNDGCMSVVTQNSGLRSGKECTESDIEIPRREAKGTLDVAPSGGNLVSGPNNADVTKNAPVPNPVSKSQVCASTQQPMNIKNVLSSQTSKIISGTELDATSMGPSVPSATNADAISSVTKSPTVLPVTQKPMLSGSASASKAPVCSKVTAGVTFDINSSQSTRLGTIRATAPFGQVTIVSSKASTVQIGTKTGTVVFPSLKTTTSPTLRKTGVPIGTKTVISPLIAKTTMATSGLSQSGGNSALGPIIKSVPNTPISVAVGITSVSSKSSLTIVDAKQKLLCVPNPPSLDMKSPFYKPKLTAKPSEVSGPPSKSSEVSGPLSKPSGVSGSPSKSSVTAVHEPPTTIAAGANVQKEKSREVNLDSKGISVNKRDDGASPKNKAKVKKKKKVGKKGSKKGGKDGAENVETGLKGVKDGGVKKKTKKDGKVKKKKLKDKNKNKSLCENKNVEKSSENVTQNITSHSQHGSSNEPQSISIVATKDRPNPRLNQGDAFNRNKQFHNQTVAPVSANTINAFVPQGHQTFQQQQLGTAQPYLSNQQTFVPVIPQPQVVPSSQFPYTQQVFAGQSNALGYGTGFNSLGTNAVFGVNPMVIPGFQQVNYYGNQVADQLNGMGAFGSVKNPVSQPKEYQHLAWL